MRKTEVSSKIIYSIQIILVCLPIVLLLFMSVFNNVPAMAKNDYDINPVVDAKVDPNVVTLYFRYTQSTFDEALLCAEEQQIEVAANENMELAIVRALIVGPQGTDETSVINPETKVISVTKNKDCYFVLLSKEFLEPFGTLSGGGSENDSKSEEQTMSNQRLAVYSIVNSLTELGICSRVQILVDVDGTGNGQRVQRKELGFTKSGNADQPVEPLGRDGSLIRTPSKGLEEILKLIINGDFSATYKQIAENSAEDGKSPSQDELVAMISGRDATISTYEILSETVSANGRTSVVTINANVKYGDDTGIEMRRTLLPMKMIRENGVWKVAYTSLENIFE